ncbi:MAG: hypothetical protein OMM_07661, partial [Candidatus Magnetoglobus multicellularis str. Araruama]
KEWEQRQNEWEKRHNIQLEKSHKEWEQRQHEWEKSHKEWEKRSNKEDEQIQKLRRSMRELRRLGVTIGFDPEEFFYDSFCQHPVLGNISFDAASRHVKGQKTEFDIVLYNAHTIGIVEVKNRLRPNRLTEFIAKLPKFRHEFPQFENFKIVAAVAAYSFDKESDKLAQKKGVYVYSRYGHKLRPIHNDDFIPKKY